MVVEPDYTDDYLIPGGMVNQDLSAGLEWANLVHNSNNVTNFFGINCAYEVDKVLEFSSQVVAGALYRVMYSVKALPGYFGCGYSTCKASIWDQPWTQGPNGPEITSFTCQ